MRALICFAMVLLGAGLSRPMSQAVAAAPAGAVAKSEIAEPTTADDAARKSLGSSGLFNRPAAGAGNRSREGLLRGHRDGEGGAEGLERLDDEHAADHALQHRANEEDRPLTS